MEDNSEWKAFSLKKEEDYSKETSELLERINATTVPVLLRSTNRPLDDIVSDILVLEKVTRLKGDVASSERLAVEALRIYRAQKDLNKMLEALVVLMKKRAQTKKVQSAMIEECAVALHDGSLSETEKVDILKRLVHVTENKIYVELEHARFTIQLSKLYVADGRNGDAASILRTLQIETITNMPRLEKLDALIYHMELCVTTRSFHHLPIVSRKINYRALGREEAVEQKLKYFELMRDHFSSIGSYFNVARCWYETYLTLKNTEDRLAALSNMVTFYIISEHASTKEIEDLAECCAFAPETQFADRSAALSGICEKLMSDMEDLPGLHFLLQRFNSIELIRDQIVKVDSEVRQQPELQRVGCYRDLFYTRSSEHDLMVVSRFYTRIPLVRLAELVGLSVEKTEDFIMKMVSNKALYAKMDRVDGLVVFEARKNAAEVVASWGEAVDRSVALLDKASHLITKERMLHNLPTTRVT